MGSTSNTQLGLDLKDPGVENNIQQEIFKASIISIKSNL